MADARVVPRLRRWFSGLLAGAVLIAAASGLVALLEPFVPELTGLPQVYLLAVLPVAIRWGTGPGVVVAVVSIVAFAFLFVPPRMSFAIADPRYGITLGFFLLAGVAVAWLAGRSRRNERESARLSQDQTALRRVATLVARGVPPEEVFTSVTAEAGRVVGADSALMLRLDADGGTTVIAGYGQDEMPVGSRWELDPRMAAAQAMRTGDSARRDDYHGIPGEAAEAVRRIRLRSVVATAIVVDGRIWGALAVGTRSERFPADCERRLAGFTDLVGTAIANTESRTQVVRLLDVQAALHRVATLVASEAPPDDVIPAVTEEIRLVLDSDATLVIRVDPDGQCTIMAQHGPHPAEMRVGERWTPDPGLAMAETMRTGRPAFRESYPGLGRAGDQLVRTMGVRHSIALPIIVDGRVWGAVGIARTRDERFPPDIAQRIAGFAELLSTAVRNTENRAQARRLLEEQAALRRVATVVARGAPPQDVFTAAADELATLLGVDVTGLYRFNGDPVESATVLSLSGWERGPLGVSFTANREAAEVLQRRESVRLDDITAMPEAVVAFKGSGVIAAVVCAVVVEGRVWGAFVAGSRTGPLPVGTEPRLETFVELIATAIANTESRAEILRLLAEQHALRRVATIVATGPSATEVSRAVAEELRRLLGVSDAGVCRFEPDGAAVLLVGIGDNLGRLPSGTRWPLGDVDSSSAVWRTGRFARFDSDRWERAAGPIIVDGQLWGTAVAWSGDQSLPADTEQRMARFTELIAMAVGNATIRSELAASRARIVAASDETRRRIERDLHDGAQQRLVSLGLELRLAQAGVPEDLPEVRAGIGRVADDLGDVLDELREMARGIHPAMLSEGGLQPALRTLVRRAPVPVELDVTTGARFPEPVEVAAYYVVSESLTNAAKHAEASRVAVSLVEKDGVIQLSVRDDGVGGADLHGGSGLIGLRDRVEALGGTIEVLSPQGGGTSVQVTLPAMQGSGSLTASRGT